MRRTRRVGSLGNQGSVKCLPCLRQGRPPWSLSVAQEGALCAPMSLPSLGGRSNRADWPRAGHARESGVKASTSLRWEPCDAQTSAEMCRSWCDVERAWRPRPSAESDRGGMWGIPRGRSHVWLKLQQHCQRTATKWIRTCSNPHTVPHRAR